MYIKLFKSGNLSSNNTTQDNKPENTHVAELELTISPKVASGFASLVLARSA
jgi:hypothetical protein